MDIVVRKRSEIFLLDIISLLFSQERTCISKTTEDARNAPIQPAELSRKAVTSIEGSIVRPLNLPTNGYELKDGRIIL